MIGWSNYLSREEVDKTRFFVIEQARALQ